MYTKTLSNIHVYLTISCLAQENLFPVPCQGWYHVMWSYFGVWIVKRSEYTLLLTQANTPRELCIQTKPSFWDYIHMFIYTLLYTHSLYSVYTINTQDINVKNVNVYWVLKWTLLWKECVEFHNLNLLQIYKDILWVRVSETA